MVCVVNLRQECKKKREELVAGETDNDGKLLLEDAEKREAVAAEADLKDKVLNLHGVSPLINRRPYVLRQPGSLV